MANRDQPVLRAKGSVTLRPWTRADAARAMVAFHEPSIQLWHMRRLDTEEEALAWIETWHERWRAETDASWAITTRDGAALGYVALRDIDLEFGYAEVTYWVLPAFRGHGIATRALSPKGHCGARCFIPTGGTTCTCTRESVRHTERDGADRE